MVGLGEDVRDDCFHELIGRGRVKRPCDGFRSRLSPKVSRSRCVGPRRLEMRCGPSPFSKPAMRFCPT
jgi:hypothetical protein